MSGPSPGPPGPTNDPLQERQLRSQIKAAWAQVGATVISALAVGVAIVVALLGQQAVDHNSQTTLEQSQDSQLSTAITALGSENVAERVAGLALLERNASARITLSSKTGESAADVFNNYQTAVRIFSGFLSSQGQAFLTAASTGQTVASFGRGYGTPRPPGLPYDVIYAADQVKLMLGLSGTVTALNSGQQPVVDLSEDELIGQPWSGVDFSGVKAFLPNIDLRGANLESSHWGKGSDLQYAHLQCANLQGANFRRADLSYADLRGANVQGASFRNTSLQGIHDTYVYGTAKWSRLPPGIKILSVKDWNQNTCLRVPAEFQPACGHHGAHVTVQKIPVTISHADCDLAGVTISYPGYGEATVARSGETGSGNSSGLTVTVQPQTLDVTVTVTGAPGNE